MSNAYGRQLVIVITLWLANAGVASAQFDVRVQPGVRVRIWLPESQAQDYSPWRRQLLRAMVTEVGVDTIRLSIAGVDGSVAVGRASMRRLDVSRGTSRVGSAFERALGFAITVAISTALNNDPDSDDWPNYRSDWRAAQQGAIWGAAVGAVVGFVFPTERWRKVRLPSSAPSP